MLLLARRWGLAIALAIGGIVPMLLAFGTNLPLYSRLWHHFSPLRYPRVPERLMPIACLALAALVAFAVAELVRLGPVWREVAVAVAVVLVVADLHVKLFGSSEANAGNRAYGAALAKQPGRLVELPVFLPDVHLGSVYLYYDMQGQKQRPGGYSTTAPKVADSTARRLRFLNCGDWTRDRDAFVRSLGVGAITFHEGLYDNTPVVLEHPWFAFDQLLKHGWQPVEHDYKVWLFAHTGVTSGRPPFPEPSHDDAVFCEGWYPQDGYGRRMSQGHSPFWVYGRGRLTLFVRSRPGLDVTFGVDGQKVVERKVGPRLEELPLPLGVEGWHLITLDTPHLPLVRGERAGARVVAYTLS